MRRIGFILLIFTGFSSFGQAPGFSAIQDVVSFKKQFALQSAKVTSIKSDFVQEKTLTLLTEKIVSKGDFLFKKNNKVRIEYKTPYSYLLIINGDQMISRDGEKESRIDVSSNKMFRQVNRIIMDCVQGTILDNKDFSVKIFESTSAYRLELTPQHKVMKEFFQSIHIVMERSDYSVSIIEMNESGGDKTVMRFTNKQFNTPINDEVFTSH
jgi:outer membrane lipoprotein-sorting protein